MAYIQYFINIIIIHIPFINKGDKCLNDTIPIIFI